MTQIIEYNEYLADALVKGTRDGLLMAGVTPNAIGVSRYITSRHEVSSIIGFVGPACGSISINLSRPAACSLAGRMLGETITELSNEALDAIAEITNIIAGKTKAVVSTSDFRIERISVPSIVVGTNYYLSHYRGLTSLAVEFELPEARANPGFDYLFTVSMSVLKV